MQLVANMLLDKTKMICKHRNVWCYYFLKLHLMLSLFLIQQFSWLSLLSCLKIHIHIIGLENSYLEEKPKINK